MVCWCLQSSGCWARLTPGEQGTLPRLHSWGESKDSHLTLPHNNLALIPLGWGVFGTRLLLKHQQRTPGFDCVSWEEGLQRENSVHRKREQVRLGDRTTIKWCEWTDSTQRASSSASYPLQLTSDFSTDVWHRSRHHQVPQHFPDITRQWEKSIGRQMSGQLPADLSSNKKWCWPATAVTHSAFIQTQYKETHLPHNILFYGHVTQIRVHCESDCSV